MNIPASDLILNPGEPARPMPAPEQPDPIVIHYIGKWACDIAIPRDKLPETGFASHHRPEGGVSFHVPEKFRVRSGRLATTVQDGNNGAFAIPASPSRGLRMALWTIASDGEGWDHVSVSTPVRCPTWEEMCVIKGVFWDDEDCVMQLHPPRSDYVNMHPFCLHLWRPTGAAQIPMPPSWMVGYKTEAA